ncbi:hypothetical protein BDQ94DRAFT_146334 [Aspergillus welwitschiae]|uniref:Uncharacterized protein n=1 Tax=Aspergillus welwitschiae TaxID=1341132 RepID=A0A3F3PYY5_9EURO|nr:hypothetical protein BDQ94DRAFT_146334 [Aspergillus welwitschiae]RDH32047.1 hypothetical protein BDQ94DRAFT_146334 [Aspergillus welwitschiae]
MRLKNKEGHPHDLGPLSARFFVLRHIHNYYRHGCCTCFYLPSITRLVACSNCSSNMSFKQVTTTIGREGEVIVYLLPSTEVIIRNLCLEVP